MSKKDKDVDIVERLSDTPFTKIVDRLWANLCDEARVFHKNQSEVIIEITRPHLLTALNRMRNYER